MDCYKVISLPLLLLSPLSSSSLLPPPPLPSLLLLSPLSSFFLLLLPTWARRQWGSRCQWPPSVLSISSELRRQSCQSSRPGRTPVRVVEGMRVCVGGGWRRMLEMKSTGCVPTVLYPQVIMYTSKAQYDEWHITCNNELITAPSTAGMHMLATYVKSKLITGNPISFGQWWSSSGYSSFSLFPGIQWASKQAYKSV